MPLVERALLTAYGDRLFEQGDCPLAEALAPIGEADALEKLSAHLRLQTQIAADFFRAPIQQILGGRLLALCIERIGLRKYIHQERRYLLRPVALHGGGLARQFNAMILPQAVTPPKSASPRNAAATPATAHTCRRRNLAEL